MIPLQHQLGCFLNLHTIAPARANIIQLITLEDQERACRLVLFSCSNILALKTSLSLTDSFGSPFTKEVFNHIEVGEPHT